MTRFADMPDDFRLRISAIVDDCGGLVSGYNGPFIQVCLPHGWSHAGGLHERLTAAGLELESGKWGMFYFPAPTGSDPESPLRHACAKYGPNRSFYLHANYRVKGGAP